MTPWAVSASQQSAGQSRAGTLFAQLPRASAGHILSTVSASYWPLYLSFPPLYKVGNTNMEAHRGLGRRVPPGKCSEGWLVGTEGSGHM